MTIPVRRVLLIAHYFPPVGGAGVQRVAKFTKYLPEQGWDVSVLTVQNPSAPVLDPSLEEEIPAETIVRFARSWEPGRGIKQRLDAGVAGASRPSGWAARCKRAIRSGVAGVLQPDPQILWFPSAVRQGRRLLREVRHDAILVSGPPFSAFLIGTALRRQSGLPLVLDYRDEWSISNRYWENKARSRLIDVVQRFFQRHVMRRTDAVLATTGRSARTLAQEAATAGRAIPVECLYNGFDPADLPEFASPASPAGEGPFRLSHVGTLWNLTTVRPLVQAVERLAGERPELATRLEVEILGRCTPAELALVERLRSLPCRLIREDYLAHGLAVQRMRAADALCLLLADVPGAERVVPGKTFEYLVTGREILAIAPPGELSDVFAGFPGVVQLSPGDVAGIVDYLVKRLSEERRAGLFSREMQRFDRRCQTGQLAGVLNRVVEESRS